MSKDRRMRGMSTPITDLNDMKIVTRWHKEITFEFGVKYEFAIKYGWHLGFKFSYTKTNWYNALRLPFLNLCLYSNRKSI